MRAPIAQKTSVEGLLEGMRLNLLLTVGGEEMAVLAVLLLLGFAWVMYSGIQAQVPLCHSCGRKHSNGCDEFHPDDYIGVYILLSAAAGIVVWKAASFMKPMDVLLLILGIICGFILFNTSKQKRE